MALARREVLMLGAIGAAAAVAGGLVGALVLQAQSGAADLLDAPFRDLSGAKRSLREWRGGVASFYVFVTFGAPAPGRVTPLAPRPEAFWCFRTGIVRLSGDAAEKIAA